MKIIEKIIKDLNIYLKDKKVLEIACGNSDFSLTASNSAVEILATDISLQRFKNRKLNEIPINIQFMEMNANNLLLENNSFDVCVCFNALGHLKDQLPLILKEMFRVSVKYGYLIFISTWKMDTHLLTEVNDIIIKNYSLVSIEHIENKTYNALIIRKKFD